MAVDAGTVFAEVRLQLNQLQGDITKMEAMFKQVEADADKTSKNTKTKFEIMGKDVGKGLDALGKTTVGGFAKMFKGLEGAIKAAPVVGLILSIVATAKKAFESINNWINETSQAYAEHQTSILKMEALVQNVGAAAWTSSRELQELAKNVARETGVATKDIMDVQTQLLSYTSITGDMFERAVRGASDAAAVMGGQASSQINALANALENPIRGMTSLSKQGFVFDEQTKDLVRTLVEEGRVLEAQVIIMETWEESYKGAATATSTLESAQQALAAAEERLALAQGKRNEVVKIAAVERKTARKEARADFVELRNAIADAEKADYSNHIAEIERLRDAVREAKSEEQLLGAQELLIKANFEFNRKQASDQLLLVQRDIKDIEARTIDAGYAMDEYSQKAYDALKKTENQLVRNIDAIDADIKKANDAASERAMNTTIEEAQLVEIGTLTDKIQETEQKRADTIADIAKQQEEGLITVEEAAKATESAERAAVNSLISLHTQVGKIKTTQEGSIKEQARVIDELNEKIRGTTRNIAELHAEIAAGPRRISGEQFNAALIEIENQIQRTQRALTTMYNEGIIGEEELSQKLQQADAAAANAAKSLLTQHDILVSGNEGFFTRIKALTDLDDGHKQYAATVKQEESLSKIWEDFDYQIAKITNDTQTLSEIEKKRALDAIKSQEGYLGASEEVQKRIEERFEEVWKAAHKNNPWTMLQSGAETYGASVNSVIDAGMGLWVASIKRENEGIQRELENRIKIEKDILKKEYKETTTSMTDLYKQKQKMYNADLQAKLFAMGLAIAATEEQYEEEYRLAVESGDHQRIFEAESNLVKFQMEEEHKALMEELEKQHNEEMENISQAHDDAQALLDQEAADKKAQLEYEVAMAEWKQAKVSAAANAALAIVSSMKAGWPVGAVLAALAAAAAGLQLATLEKNKPQKFSTGGIVAGSSFRGDMVPTMQNSREMDLNMGQQRNLFNAINNDELGGNNTPMVNVTVPVYLDGKIIATSTADYVNRRQVIIRQRSMA